MDIEEQTNHFIHGIKSAINKAVISQQIFNNNLPQNLQKLIKVKNKIRRKYQKDRSSINLIKYKIMQ